MNEHWKSPLGQLVLPVLVLIASICTGTLALGLWRSFDVVMARDARMLAEQQKFHTESVAAIQRLAENAGIMTSADLCPVRFRLRDENGLGDSPEVSLCDARRRITAREWIVGTAGLDEHEREPGVRPETSRSISTLADDARWHDAGARLRRAAGGAGRSSRVHATSGGG